MIQKAHTSGDVSDEQHMTLRRVPDNQDEPARSADPAHDEDAISGPAIGEIVRRLHEGALAPGDLDAALRRQCVAHLTFEGFSTSEIAELMSITDRTVRRDRAAMRKEEALEPSLTLGDELLGEFQRFALASVQRLTRLATDHGTPAYARLWAEDAIARVYQRFIETARKLGYIETGEMRLHKSRQATRESEQRTPTFPPHVLGLSDNLRKHSEDLMGHLSADG